MKLHRTVLFLAAAVLPVALSGQVQGLDPILLGKPAVDGWPTYHGDYSGRRYSTLNQITTSNIKSLSLAWIYRANPSLDGPNVGGEYKSGDPYYWGGPPDGVTFKATPLMVNGIIYISAPDHAYAVDARTGREIWHYAWRTRGGIHIGNRGMPMYGSSTSARRRQSSSGSRSSPASAEIHSTCRAISNRTSRNRERSSGAGTRRPRTKARPGRR